MIFCGGSVVVLSLEGVSAAEQGHSYWPLWRWLRPLEKRMVNAVMTVNSVCVCCHGGAFLLCKVIYYVKVFKSCVFDNELPCEVEWSYAFWTELLHSLWGIMESTWSVKYIDCLNGPSTISYSSCLFRIFPEMNLSVMHEKFYPPSNCMPETLEVLIDVPLMCHTQIL